MSAVEIANMLGEINFGVEYSADNPFGDSHDDGIIVTDTNPADLIYPHGWCFSDGFLKRKDCSDNERIPFVRHNGRYW